MKLLDAPSLSSLEALERAYMRIASSASTFVLLLQVATVMLGWYATRLEAPMWWLPCVLAAIAVLAASFRLWSESCRREADGIKRRRELLDGLGRQLSGRELADMVDSASVLTRRLAESSLATEPYFASTEPPGPRRLVLNTFESAWWTARQATDMLRFQVALVCAIVVTALALLEGAIVASSDGMNDSLVRAAASALLFVATGAPIRDAIGFSALIRGASDVCRQAENVLKSEVAELEAVEILFAYQLARKGSPSLSTPWWRLRRKNLNKLWAQIHADTRALTP